MEKTRPESLTVIKDTDTGQTWIARGGPGAKGAAFVAEALTGTLTVTSEVKPSAQSQDTQVINDQHKAVTDVASTTLKDVSGSDAVAKAQQYSDKVNSSATPYDASTNSNSVANGMYKTLTGQSVGGPDNWGHDSGPAKGPAKPQNPCATGGLCM